MQWKTYAPHLHGKVNEQPSHRFKQKVTEALLKLDDPALLESFPRSGFIPASNDDYEPIRATAENIGILD